MNNGIIFDEVQAALLNSECSPKYAVERALLAVMQFAIIEADLTVLEFDDMTNRAWAAGREGGLW